MILEVVRFFNVSLHYQFRGLSGQDHRIPSGETNLEVFFSFKLYRLDDRQGTKTKGVGTDLLVRGDESRNLVKDRISCSTKG